MSHSIIKKISLEIDKNKALEEATLIENGFKVNSPFESPPSKKS